MEQKTRKKLETLEREEGEHQKKSTYFERELKYRQTSYCVVISSSIKIYSTFLQIKLTKVLVNRLASA
jgi:hypothetical protein